MLFGRLDFLGVWSSFAHLLWSLLNQGLLLCRVLDLTECRGISTQSLQQCLTSLKRLQVLELSGDTEVRDQLCLFIMRHLCAFFAML